MSVLLANLLSLCNLKYFIIDKYFRILKVSDESFPIVKNADDIKVGCDLRSAFPELIGMEEIIQEILDGNKDKFEFKAIARPQVDLSDLYIDIKIAKNIGFPNSLDSHSEPDGQLIVLLEDVTERMLLEQSLVQGANESNLILKTLSGSKQYIDQIINSMADGLLVTTLSGKIQKANPTAQRLLEYSQEELIGQPISAIIKGIENWKWQIELNHAYGDLVDNDTKHLTKEIETTCLTKNGHQVPIAFSYSEVETQVENFQGYVYILRDITERKQAELAKQEFLAMISHEIRTPIASVIGMATILMEMELTSEQQQFVDTINASGNTLLNIINDILDFSKIEAGKLELEAEYFDLDSCINSVLSMLSPQAQEKGLKLSFVSSPDIPEVIIGDITRLTQILINLINNAIKFTETGKVEISIASSKLRENEDQQQIYELLFTVTDTGIGIPHDRLNRLFQVFSQVNSSISRQFGGTGLGLAICKLICELMGGRIWVESEVGVGTTFYFTIVVPVEERNIYENNSENASESFQEENTTCKNDAICADYPLNILLVDDYPVNQKLITMMLQRMGYQPDIASNGLEAIAALGDKSYDIVLMDIQMPEMDGLTATQHICNKWNAEARPRIIALTASTAWLDKENFNNFGFESYLIKPFHIEDLKQVLLKNKNLSKDVEINSDISKITAIESNILQEVKKIAELNPSINSAEFILEIINEYLNELPLLLEAIQVAFDENSIDVLKIVSHKFSSCCANLGANNLVSLCQELEVIMIDETLVGLKDKINQIILEYKKVRAILVQERQKYLSYI
ncbi:MAG: ATP-binding protein [Cyanobacteria bacterium P01_A01_bin.84]